MGKKNHTNLYLFYSIFSVILLILFSGGCITLYQNGIKEILKMSNLFLTESISIDMNKRFDKGNIPFFWGVNGEQNSNNITIQYKDSTTIVEKNENMQSLSIEEKQTMAIQSYLLIVSPIQPQVVDSIFCSILASNGIFTQTAIRYTDKNKNYSKYSNSDSFFYESSFPTKEIHLGINQEMSVQGYIKLPISTIISYSRLHFALWGIICIGAAVMITIIIKFRKKKITQISQLIPYKEIESNDNINRNILTKISKDIFFDPQKGHINYKGQILQLQKLSAELLIYFLEVPDHFISNENMEEKLRGIIINSKTWRSQTIKRLREALSSIPEIRIENNRGRGYRMIIKKDKN